MTRIYQGPGKGIPETSSPKLRAAPLRRQPARTTASLDASQPAALDGPEAGLRRARRLGHGRPLVRANPLRANPPTADAPSDLVHRAVGESQVGAAAERDSATVADRPNAGRSAVGVLERYRRGSADSESSRIADTVMRAKLTTHGGEFESIGYDPVQPPDLEAERLRVGCSMFLRFRTFPWVACEQYGFVQMVDYQDDGQPAYPAGWPDTQQRRGRPGQFIDKKQEYITPVFSAGNPPAIFTGPQYQRFLETLQEAQAVIVEDKKEVDEDSGWVFVDMDFSRQQRTTLGDQVMGILGQHMEPATGLPYTPSKDVLTSWGYGVDPTEESEEGSDIDEEYEGTPASPASMYDRPSHPLSREKFQEDAVTSSRRFETTALCAKGTMDGTYLGSVEWGYYTRNSRVELYDFRIISMGAPSADFQAAATGWNQSQVTVGDQPVRPMQLPANSAVVTREPASHEALADRVNQVRALIHQLAGAATEAQINQRKNTQLEAQFLMAVILTRGRAAIAAEEPVAYRTGESLRAFALRATGDRDQWVDIFALNTDVLGFFGPAPANNTPLRIPRRA